MEELNENNIRIILLRQSLNQIQSAICKQSGGNPALKLRRQILIIIVPSRHDRELRSILRLSTTLSMRSGRVDQLISVTNDVNVT